MKLLTELGAVYVPDGNPNYAYLVVHLDIDPLDFIDDDLSIATVQCLQLWSNSSVMPVGRVWSEPLKQFEEHIRQGRIVRWRKGLKEK